jgi:hypothetical protein
MKTLQDYIKAGFGIRISPSGDRVRVTLVYRWIFRYSEIVGIDESLESVLEYIARRNNIKI